MKLAGKLLANVVEIVCGVAMIVVGVILQVHGSAKKPPDATALVIGGLLIAFGGVLLAWIGSRIYALEQAEIAVANARQEVEQKLDNLSRVLGQAAGQISRAVEQYESGETDSATGFALVSQANRMVYGQVNEIAVIRGTGFDSGYLLDTAEKLDDLARELSSSGAPEPGHIAEVRQRIEEFRENLAVGSAGITRSYQDERVACPYCTSDTTVQLGTVPGDTVHTYCSACMQGFNVHRSAAGSPFTRKAGPTKPKPTTTNTATPADGRFIFPCPSCGARMAANGQDKKILACARCWTAVDVDPVQQSAAASGTFEVVTTETCTRSGSRPRVVCPHCQKSLNALLRTPEGFVGLCVQDRMAVRVPYEVFTDLLREEAETAILDPTKGNGQQAEVQA